MKQGRGWRDGVKRWMPWVVLLVGVTSSTPAWAAGFMGQQLLTFASDWVIGPLGLFALIGGLLMTMFNSKAAGMALGAAVTCAIIFGIIKAAPTLLTALQS